MNFPKLDLKKTGEKIKQLRLKNNMTRTELADKLYTKYDTIWKWEAGKNCPGIDSLIMLSFLFNVKLDDILIFLEIENNNDYDQASDLISRQAAIAAIDKEQKEIDVSDVSAMYAYSKCKAIIKQLPPTQPEIVRCGECKYAHLTYNKEVKYCDFWKTEDPIYMSADNFCSNAERREVTE